MPCCPSCRGQSYGIQRWIIGSCKNALINNGTDPNYYADLEALEATAQVNPFLNFTFDRTNVEGICASILNVYYEYGPQIDNGVAGAHQEEENIHKALERPVAAVLDFRIHKILPSA